MKVILPVMVQDPFVAWRKGADPFDKVKFENEDFFLDGPITKDLAVLDFDPDTGKLSEGVKFQPPQGADEYGCYHIPQIDEPESSEFLRVNAFSTVLMTKGMFEEQDALGRRVEWAFDGPQLFIVPRAGKWANAFYERDSHSLQLFYFPSPLRNGTTVYTSLSRDIIAHETAHAILDGIAPDLYDAITPQSLALHEGVADLTAVLISMRSKALMEKMLSQTRGSIGGENALNKIAEQFGMERYPKFPRTSLRDLLNTAILGPENKKNSVCRYKPHELSTVLSGAMYSLLVNMHERKLPEYRNGDPKKNLSGPCLTLHIVGRWFKRMIYRGLDYLPPGEASFADLARAIIASDQAFYDIDIERRFIRTEFKNRGIVPEERCLDVPSRYDDSILDGEDLETLATSDWRAYQFVNDHRDIFHIHDGRPFEVRPRLVVEKTYHREDGEKELAKELIFKVAWDQEEKNNLGPPFPPMRRITVGTTMAIRWDGQRINAILTSNHEGTDEQAEQEKDRDDFTEWMVVKGLLLPKEETKGLETFYHNRAVALTTGRFMHVKGSGRMLHIAEGV